MNGSGFSGGPPPRDGDEPHQGIIEGGLARKANLRVVGGVVDGLRRPDLLAAIKQWHKGQRDRKTGEVQPWSTIALVHMESGRPIRQFDVAPDEDDLELAIEIETAMDNHGKPLASSQGVTQNYTLDAYFGTRVDPQGQWVGNVNPSANLDGFGMNSGRMMQRGTPQDFEAQRFRSRELEISASFGLTRYNVELLVDQIRQKDARIATLEAREDAVKERERLLKKEENDHQLNVMRETSRIKRNMFLVAKVTRYLPIIAAKLDERLFGLSQLSPEERSNKATDVVKTLLSKLPNNEEGAARFEEVAAILNLTAEDKQKINDLGVMMWLEEEKQKLQREKEIAQKGGFAGLGDDLKSLLGEAPGRNMFGEGKKES